MDTVVLAVLGLVIAAQVAVIVLARRGGAPARRPAAPPPAQAALPDISRLGHELRTPLNSVITLSQLLEEGSAGVLNEAQRGYVRIINRNGQSLLAMINHVVDLARIDCDRADVRLHAIDAEPIVREVVRGLAARATAKSLALHASLPRDVPPVRADEDRLRQVLTNVIGCAVQLTAHGEVAVSAEPVGGSLAIHVRDTSNGLPEDVRAVLGGANAALGRNAELALGLLLARRLVELMGGELTATGGPGSGSTFAITLPLVQERAHTLAGPDGEPADSGVGSVLIIDDDDGERQQATSLVEGAGFRVTLATSGREGLDLLRRERFDAVVLDMVMPEMTGLDVLRAVQRDGRLASASFIVLSAMIMTWTERELLGSGVVGVVQKGPSMAATLLPALRKAITRSRGGVHQPGEGVHP